VLAGELDAAENTFTVISLVIPRQKGEQNNVEMHGEEDLVEYVIGKNLVTLGWIHSHPTQTCFLSSIDVHTHFPYQACLRRRALAKASGRKRAHVLLVCWRG
jgi:STAM-binding protein